MTDETTRVGVLAASPSELSTMRQAGLILEKFGVGHEIRIMSSSRNPDLVDEYARTAFDRGLNRRRIPAVDASGIQTDDQYARQCHTSSGFRCYSSPRVGQVSGVRIETVPWVGVLRQDLSKARRSALYQPESLRHAVCRAERIASAKGALHLVAAYQSFAADEAAPGSEGIHCSSPRLRN